jgi:hypothetical protein
MVCIYPKFDTCWKVRNFFWTFIHSSPVNFLNTFFCQCHRFLIMKQYSATLPLGEMDTDPVPDRQALVANLDSAK